MTDFKANIGQVFVAVLALAYLCVGAKAAETKFPFDVPHLNEEAMQAGIMHQYQGPWEFFVGGGAASFDCNRDRMPDLFVAGGSNTARLFINRSKSGEGLKFVPAELDLDDSDLKNVLGAYPVNLDNDGFIDLVVLRLGENLLLHGGPDCSFDKANRRFAFDGGRRWSTAFSAIWEKDQIFPTLAVGNYVDRNAPGSPWGTCDKNFLHRPDSNNIGRPNYGHPIELTPGFCALSLSFTDWNKSGHPALRISNDRQYYRGGQEQLWDIRPAGQPRRFGEADGWKSLTIWGMGIAEADLNGDGFPEYALTSMGDTKLMTLDNGGDQSRPTYRDIAFEKGATAHRPYTGGENKPSTGWHSQFADFNNDSRLDLFIAKGNVEAMPDFAAFDPDNLRLSDHLGKFHEKGDEAGIGLNTKGRGAIVEDFNADGMLDLFVVNRSGNASLFRNLGAKTSWGHRPMGNWLMLELRNGATNPQSIGAKIHVKTGNLNQTRTIQIGGGHASGQIGFVHVGLGVAERANIRVQWPNGEWSHEYRIFANNFVVIDRSETDPKYWYPR